jgi:hypothetical protein
MYHPLESLKVWHCYSVYWILTGRGWVSVLISRVTRAGGKAVWRTDGRRGEQRTLSFQSTWAMPVKEYLLKSPVVLSRASFHKRRQLGCMRGIGRCMMRWAPTNLARSCKPIFKLCRLVRMFFGECRASDKKFRPQDSAACGCTVKMAPIIPSQEELDRRKVSIGHLA